MLTTYHRLSNGGLLEPGFPRRRYKYQLLDPVDEPYAAFRFQYRSYGQILEAFPAAELTMQQNSSRSMASLLLSHQLTLLPSNPENGMTRPRMLPMTRLRLHQKYYQNLRLQCLRPPDTPSKLIRQKMTICSGNKANRVRELRKGSLLAPDHTCYQVTPTNHSTLSQRIALKTCHLLCLVRLNQSKIRKQTRVLTPCHRRQSSHPEEV